MFSEYVAPEEHVFDAIYARMARMTINDDIHNIHE
jgi:hypothetical protein